MFESFQYLWMVSKDCVSITTAIHSTHDTVDSADTADTVDTADPVDMSGAMITITWRVEYFQFLDTLYLSHLPFC